MFSLEAFYSSKGKPAFVYTPSVRLKGEKKQVMRPEGKVIQVESRRSGNFLAVGGTAHGQTIKQRQTCNMCASAVLTTCRAGRYDDDMQMEKCAALVCLSVVKQVNLSESLTI